MILGGLSTAASYARTPGANDRINVGSIGTGGMGGGHLRSLVAQSKEPAGKVRVAAVCDVYNRRRERARELAGLAEKDAYNDYRELLARKDVDAVFIATPDHWHARMALDAMAAGKDVYLQKPMTYTVEEARQVAEAAAQAPARAPGGQPAPFRRALPRGAQAHRAGRDRRAAVGAGKLQPQQRVRRVELPHRRGGHRAEHRLGPLARQRAQARLQRRALLPLAQVLGLFRRHRHGPLLPQARPDSFRHGGAVSHARDGLRRHLRAQGPRGAGHLRHHHRIPELLHHAFVVDGQCGRRTSTSRT